MPRLSCLRAVSTAAAEANASTAKRLAEPGLQVEEVVVGSGEERLGHAFPRLGDAPDLGAHGVDPGAVPGPPVFGDARQSAARHDHGVRPYEERPPGLKAVVRMRTVPPR